MPTKSDDVKTAKQCGAPKAQGGTTSQHEAAGRKGGTAAAEKR